VTVPVGVLTNLAQSLQVVRSGPAEVRPGQRVGVKVIPPASELRVTDVLDGAFDVSFLTKNIRFGDATVEPALDAASLNPQILGGMPIPGLATIEGIPALLGRLTGSIPIPADLPVRVEVKWSVRDSDTNRTDISGQAGTAFLAPDGLGSPEASFVFPPQVVELTSTPAPPAVQRFIRASVSLTAGGTSTPFVDLPDVPVLIPALPVPTVLALFLHTNFEPRQNDDDGAVLIVVPSNSPLRTVEQLQPLLNALESTVSSLSSFAGFAAFLLGLRDLTAALPAQPHVQFRATDGIGNLNDITLIQRGIFENDTEAEDELSSLIFIGPAGKVVQCFNARNFDNGEGQIDITIGQQLFAVVRNLHSRSPVSEPTGGEIAVVRPSTEDDRFGDELSSLRFA
jgi:hypothetical protein